MAELKTLINGILDAEEQIISSVSSIFSDDMDIRKEFDLIKNIAFSHNSQLCHSSLLGSSYTDRGHRMHKAFSLGDA